MKMNQQTRTDLQQLKDILYTICVRGQKVKVWEVFLLLCERQTCRKTDEMIRDTMAIWLLLAVCVFCAGLLETEALSVTGEMGGKVSIKCSHANAFSNIKYFCKGECRSEDVLISSRDKKDLNSKYVISDEGNKFTVTISHLTKDDSGTYWCGIDRVGLDTYNKVVLTVIEGEMTQCYVCSVHEESFYDGEFSIAIFSFL